MPLVRWARRGLVSPIAAASISRFRKYYFDGKEKRLSLGHYSNAGSPKVVVSLRDGRNARDRARLEHRTGVDPVQRRRLDKLTRGAATGVTFEAVARELHGVKQEGWSEHYAKRWIKRMERICFLGSAGSR